MGTEAPARATLPPEQREALVTALELGYFDVPRKADLAELAAALGVPADIAAVRLRQATKTHLANTLVMDGAGVRVES